MSFGQLNASLKEAMMAKDEFKVSLLRMLVAAVHNREIENKGKGKALADNDVVDVLKKELKKRKESAEMYKTAGRAELADKEIREAGYISSLLPAQMGDDQIEAIVSEVLKEFLSPSQKDFGAIMKKVMEQVAGKADGSAVSAVIKKHLT